jgi:transcriptional regulator with XRE-family HTH domain
MQASTPPVGLQLREWRQRRRLSQLDLAGHAEVSTRHLSFVETGRSLPSREMVLRLADRLEVPLRERNRLLTAAGYAPLYAEHRLDDPAMQAARQAVDLVLKAHEPCPALAVDRHWNLVSQNRMVPMLLDGLPGELLAPPLNVLRLSLHPQGLAPRIVNLGQWRAHLLLQPMRRSPRYSTNCGCCRRPMRRSTRRRTPMRGSSTSRCSCARRPVC